MAAVAWQMSHSTWAPSKGIAETKAHRFLIQAVAFILQGISGAPRASNSTAACRANLGHSSLRTFVNTGSIYSLRHALLKISFALMTV